MGCIRTCEQVFSGAHRDDSDTNGTYFIVMPAKAGIQSLSFSPNLLKSLDSSFRWNDGGGWMCNRKPMHP